MRLTLAVLATALVVGLAVGGAAPRLGILSTGVAAAEQTWTGNISDSTCGASHTKMSQGLFTPHECTLACTEKGKFVFVGPGDKVMEIANQDFPALKEMAGETVTLTGELNNDQITIAKMELKK
jgi:hypothetical protein